MTVPKGPPGIEECEDPDCTGCRWCDAAKVVAAGHLFIATDASWQQIAAAWPPQRQCGRDGYCNSLAAKGHQLARCPRCAAAEMGLYLMAAARSRTPLG